jgi:hypothetical protein
MNAQLKRSARPRDEAFFSAMPMASGGHCQEIS